MSITRLTRPLIESVAKTIKPYGDIIELDFQHNNIEILENLQSLSMTELAILNLSYNRLQSLQNLVPIASLRELRVSANSLVSVDTALPFPKLQLLDLSENKIYRVSAELPDSLLELDLRSNLICTFESIAPVFKLHNLVSLDLRQNPIIDVYISSESFKVYATKFLPKLEMLNGELVALPRQTTASQMQLSRLERSSVAYDLSESRIAGVASNIGQSRRPEERSSALTQPAASQQISSQQGHQDAGPEVNIKIYSNYYDKPASKSTEEHISDFQRMINEHVIVYKSPSARRLGFSRQDNSETAIKHVRSASQTGAEITHRYDKARSFYDGNTSQSDTKPIVIQRAKSFRAMSGGVLQEMHVIEPTVTKRASSVQETTRSNPYTSITPIESAEEMSQKDALEPDTANHLARLKRKCMEQEIELQRLGFELKAASEILEKNNITRGLLARDSGTETITKMQGSEILFTPTISGPNEYAKLLSQADYSELALLKTEVQALEESIRILENDFVVTFPHSEADKSKLHSALYAYRRLVFHLLLAKERCAVEAKRAQDRLGKEVSDLQKQLREYTENAVELNAKKNLQEVQLKDAELQTGIKQQTIEALSNELQKHRLMFDQLLDMYSGGKNSLISSLAKHSISHLVEVIEQTVDMMRGKLIGANQSVQAATSMLSRQKLRIEALTDELDDYKHKYATIQSEHEELLSRYDALKETYKNLQLEKINLETDHLDNPRKRHPCVDFAIQVRPQADKTVDLDRRPALFENAGDAPMSPIRGRNVHVTSTNPPTSSISATALVSRMGRSMAQNSLQSSRITDAPVPSQRTLVNSKSDLIPNDMAPDISLQVDNQQGDVTSEDSTLEARMAEHKRLAAEMRDLQTQSIPRSSSSNRKRAEHIMGILSRLDSLM